MLSLLLRMALPMERGLPMFDAKELASLDDRYFVIIYRDPYDITIRSK